MSTEGDLNHSINVISFSLFPKLITLRNFHCSNNYYFLFQASDATPADLAARRGRPEAEVVVEFRRNQEVGKQLGSAAAAGTEPEQSDNSGSR